MRRYAAVIPVSRYILEDWAAAAGIPEARMHVVHHGVDLDALRARVSRPAHQVRAALGVPPGRVLALMVGNVREWKGQHVVLDALSLLDEQTRAAIFVAFAGAAGSKDQKYLARLQETVTRSGLEDCVSFLGARSDVPDLLNAADIALHASVRPEPGGIAVLEAMALGKTVVAADVGGHAEVLTPQSGFTFDTASPRALAEHLTRLVHDEGLRRETGMRARARMEEFGIDRNVRETQSVYEAVLVRRRPRLTSG
jgi:glycosyltransferase involved in cell wall biosynthesis